MKVLKYSCATIAMAAALGFSQVASAIPILSFSIDGDTAYQPWTLTNNSTAGEQVTGFYLDITSTGGCFDINNVNGDACPGNAANGLTPFNALHGSNITTGLVPPSVNDGDTVLDFIFNDFDAGETLQWYLDVDPIGAGPNGAFGGNLLIGSTGWVDFSNGDRLFGTVGAVENNSDASAFTVIGQLRLAPTEGPEIILVPQPDPDPVPLPSTLSLLACALLGLRMRKRKSA